TVGAANALNCWLERDRDRLMARTCGRPLPAGRMEPGVALGVGLLLAVVSLRSEEHTSELQSLTNLVCRLLLEKKKNSTTERVDQAQYVLGKQQKTNPATCKRCALWGRQDIKSSTHQQHGQRSQNYAVTQLPRV